MAKRAIWLLIRSERMVNEDGAAGEAIIPGQLVRGEATINKHNVAGGQHSYRFALEREEMGKSIDTAYAVGDTVKIGTVAPGDRVYAFIPSGHNIASGTFLESNGDGNLRTQAGAGIVVGRAIETVNNAAGVVTARIRVEIA